MSRLPPTTSLPVDLALGTRDRPAYRTDDDGGRMMGFAQGQSTWIAASSPDPSALFIAELSKSDGAAQVFRILVDPSSPSSDTTSVSVDTANGTALVSVADSDEARRRVDDLVWYDASTKHPVPVVLALDELLAIEADNVSLSTLLDHMQSVGNELAASVRQARPTLDQLRAQLVAGHGTAEVIRASLAQEASMDASGTNLRELEVAVRMLTGRTAQRRNNVETFLAHYGAALVQDTNAANIEAITMQAEYDLRLVAVLHDLAVQYGEQLHSLIDRGTHLLEAQRATLVGFQSAFFAAIGVAIALGQLLGTDTVNFPALVRREAVFTTVVVASLAFAIGLLTAGESLDATRKGTLHEALLLTAIPPAIALACVTLSSSGEGAGAVRVFVAGVVALGVVILGVAARRVHKKSRR